MEGAVVFHVKDMTVSTIGSSWTRLPDFDLVTARSIIIPFLSLNT